MATTVSVKSKQTIQQWQQHHWKYTYVQGGLGCYLLQCHAKEGVLLSLGAWLYVQTRDLICLVCYSFSCLWWVVVWIWENPLCLHQRVVEWLWCIPVNPPTIINSNEDVPNHSSFPLRVRWFPECWLKRMPITLTSFTLSTIFILSSNPCLHTKSSQIPRLPTSLLSPWAVIWQRFRYL